MPNHLAVHSIASSIVTYLSKSYPKGVEGHPDCEFRLLSSQELASKDEPPPRLTLYLYRVTVNEHLRNTTRGKDPDDTGVPLSLDLHFLLTAWTGSALTELAVMAWAMRQLHTRPLLDLSMLSKEALWDSSDAIQLTPAQLSTEDMMRIWDALDPPYHLSVGYTARVVRIDPDRVEPARPVVATRLSFAGPAGDEESA